MKFKRRQTIEQYLSPKRVLVVYGPRRIGKTTLLHFYLEKNKDRKIFSAIGDDIRIRELFQSQVRDDILDFAKRYEIIAIDEAQYIPFIGLGVKMIIDAYPEKTVILTGSSSLNISSEIGEPLTGRHYTLTLLPISQLEIEMSRFELRNNLEKFLIYGSYPEVLLADSDKEREFILNELISSYLYKDALAYENIKSPDLLKDIARMIAFQVGSEVSYNEIARALSVDVKTVGKYLDLLEKMFVIKKVRGFSRNLKNEITKKSKYYFLDNGVRNAIIGQFSPLSLRDDIGRLWENFIFMELFKISNFKRETSNYYFWRTHTQSEIDIIREYHGKIYAFECKYKPSYKYTLSKLWQSNYPDSKFQIIHKDNYLEVLSSLESD